MINPFLVVYDKKLGAASIWWRDWFNAHTWKQIARIEMVKMALGRRARW